MKTKILTHFIITISIISFILINNSFAQYGYRPGIFHLSEESLGINPSQLKILLNDTINDKQDFIFDPRSVENSVRNRTYIDPNEIAYAKNNKIEEININYGDRIIQKKYDKNGNLIYYSSKANYETFKYEYFFKYKDNKVIEDTNVLFGYKEVFNYDNDNLIQFTQYDKDNKIRESYSYIYNRQNQLVESKDQLRDSSCSYYFKYNKKGNLLSLTDDYSDITTNYKYHHKDNLTTITHYDNINKRMTQGDKFIYTKNAIRQILLETDGHQFKYITLLDVYGRIIENTEMYYEHSRCPYPRKTSIKYNDLGNIIEIRRSGSDLFNGVDALQYNGNIVTSYNNIRWEYEFYP